MSSKTIKVRITALVIGFFIISSLFIFLYNDESNKYLKGRANYELSYRFQMENTGPLNLTSVSLRLALLKTFNPIQNVHGLNIQTLPNETFNDEYNNTYARYEYENFIVGQNIDLRFDVNITVNLLDYSGIDIPSKEFDTENKEYKLYTRYHYLADTTDPAIQSTAQEISDDKNPVDVMYDIYNFTSTYLNYRLLSTSRGSSFALRNGYGDCDEFTNLFIALARARGIPAIEHTAWLADFKEGFETTDEGSAAHAYPMFYIQDMGLLPVDPTRGSTNLFDNWLKSDEKKITLTRGPDQPYRSLIYRWIPVEGFSDPIVSSNYTISIHKMSVEYFSKIRIAAITLIIAIPVLFVIYNLIKGYNIRQQNLKKLDALLNPKLK